MEYTCSESVPLPFVSDEVVIGKLGLVEGHPCMGQPAHIVIVLSSILCCLVQTLQCGPGEVEGEEGREERSEERG